MILFKELKFSNWFSYSEDTHTVNLNDSKLIQILGDNGSGKSSIPLILEEVLYGKNFKSILKADIPNRESNSTIISANVLFTIHNSEYELIYKRNKDKTTISLLENGVDISSHKNLDTYKTINELLGLSYDTFHQLIYQSSTNSLYFLKGTDSQKKEFLSSLFQLSEYKEYLNNVKDVAKTTSDDILVNKTNISNTDRELNNLKVPEYIELRDVKYFPENITSLENIVSGLRDERAKYLLENEKISRNNAIKHQLDQYSDIKDINERPNISGILEELEQVLDDIEVANKVNCNIDTANKIVPVLEKPIDTDLNELINKLESTKQRKLTIQNEIAVKRSVLAKLDKLKSEHKCPVCFQEISNEFTESLYAENNIDILNLELSNISLHIQELKNEIDIETNNFNKQLALYNTYNSNKELIETYAGLDKKDISILEHKKIDLLSKKEEAKREIDRYNKNEARYLKFKQIRDSIDYDLSTELYDIDTLDSKIKEVEDQLKLINQSILETTIWNEKAKINNKARIDALNTKQTLEDKLNKLQLENESLQELNKYLEMLKKAFSNTGILAYKLESLIKTLESQINDFLDILSGGKFNIEFILENEKLITNVIHNDKVVNIDTLSAGEFSRVNVATLLAIRKILSIINKTKINVLFLDEIMGVLDTDGKEQLVSILLEEHDLNVFLVDHTYKHPLIPTINVIKKGNVSNLVVE